MRVNTIVRPGAAVRSTRTAKPVLGAHVQHVVRHLGDRRLRRVDAVGDRVGEEPLDEHVDPRVEGRGEQQALARTRGLVEQPPHDGQEAEVGHVVGLVEHGDLDGVEVRVARLEMVGEPAGAGDEDVDAGAQGR